MKWVRRLLLIGGVVVVVAAAALWRAEPRLGEALRAWLEAGLAEATGAPAVVGSVKLSLVPLRVEVHDVALGPAGALARLGVATVELDAGASLLALRPVLSLGVAAVEADLTQLPPRPAPTTTEPVWIPPLRLASGVVDGIRLRFPMDHGPGDLGVDRIEVEGAASLGAVWLEGQVAVHGAHLQRQAYSARLERVEISGGMGSAGLFVRDGRVVGDGITATLRATETPGRTKVKGIFRPAILGVVVDELGVVDGVASVEGWLDGDLTKPVLDAQLVIEDGTIAGRYIGDLSARALFRDVNLHFANVEFVGPAGRLRGDVDIILDEEVPIRVDAQCEDVDLEGVLARSGVDVPVRVRLDGTLSMRGQLDPTDFTVFGRGRMRSLDGDPPDAEADWEASFRLLKDDLAVRLSVRQPRNTVSGELLLAAHRFGGGVTVAVAQVADLVPLLPVPVMELAPSGQIRGDARFAGTTERPAFGGSVDARDLTLGGAPIRRVRGDFAIGAAGLSTRETVVETPAGVGVLSGTIALQPEQQNDWSVRLDNLNIDATVALIDTVTGTGLPVSGGTVSGTGRCTGPWASARCEAGLDARWLRVGPEPFQRITAQASGTLPAWDARLRAERTDTEALRVEGSGVGVERLDLRLQSDPLHLSSLFSGETGVTGSITVDGRLTGTLERLDGAVEVVGADIAVRRQPLGDVRLRAVARGGDWMVDGDALSGMATLRATVPSTARGASALELRWRDLEVGPMVDPDGTLSVRSAGVVDLRGVGVAPDAVRGVVRLDELEIARGAYRVAAREPITIRLDGGRFSVVSATLTGPKSSLTLSGEWVTDGAVNLGLEGEGDLVLLELALDEIQSASGPFTVNARVRHRPGGPWDLGGEAHVRDGVIDADLPVALTSIDGDFVLRGGVVEVGELSGRAGNGTFAIGGTLDLGRGPALTWRVEDVAMTAPEWLEERFSGNGVVEGTWQSMLVRGDIDVEYALYQRQVAITDFLPWLKGQLAPPPAVEPPERVVALDLHLRAPDSLYVENDYAKAELAADLRIGGTVDAPRVTGVVEVLSGDVTVNKRVFTVTGGSVDFRDATRINPILNLGAETQILTKEGLYLVTVTVSGTADKPRVQFGSDDPSLTQNDILSLVATGRTAKQAERDTTGFSPASALAFVPTRGVQNLLSDTIGLDLFELDTGRVEDTGPVLPRVTIGKQLTEDLRVTASNTLVETLTRVTADYRLGRRFSVYGTWESQSKSGAGAFGGGGTLRYGFRNSPFSLLRGLQNLRPPVDAP